MIPDRLTPPDGALQDCQRRLAPVWVDYCQNVSPANMAMGRMACAYILWLAETFKPYSAVDFGSGLTSYVLRSAGVPHVLSVDDNQEWLDKTARFLKRYRIASDRLHLWTPLSLFLPASYDLVVYDFSCGEMRDAHFAQALSLMTRDGIAVLDDANHPDHHQSMEEAAEKHGRELYLLDGWCKDEFGRFPAVVC